jgi:hypothetical protein
MLPMLPVLPVINANFQLGIGNIGLGNISTLATFQRSNVQWWREGRPAPLSAPAVAVAVTL